MNKTTPLRFTYRIDWQPAVHCGSATQAFRDLQEALEALTEPASAEIRDRWTGAQLAAFVRSADGRIEDVPF